MEFSYFRKSTRSYDETVEKTRAATTDAGFTILAEKDLEPGAMYMFVACKAEWAKTLLKADHRLSGFLPCSLVVLKQGNDVLVGTGQPAIIKSLVQQGPLADIAVQADAASKHIIHEAAGVEALKPTGVRVFATHTCQYCTKVKAWLEGHKVPHNVLYVDQDRDAGQEMVQKTGQMGVPVTEISYGEDAEPAYVIGFDESRLQELLQV